MSVDFLDSNVLLYLFDDVDEHKQSVATRLVESSISNGSALISYQVVQEVLNVLDRKLALGTEDQRQFLGAVLMPLWNVSPTRNLYMRALDTKARYGFSFYDSLIVSAALEAGCKRLLSEDLQHGQKIGALEISNPFRATA